MILGDMTGDGRPEIFIAPALTCGNGGCIWSVYSPTGVPHELRYVGQAAFSPEAYLMEATTLSHCWHNSAASCQLGEYRITQNRIQPRDFGECRTDDSGCAKRLKAIDAWQHSPANLLFEATIGKIAALSGLHWTTLNDRAAANALPDLDHSVVLAGSGT